MVSTSKKDVEGDISIQPEGESYLDKTAQQVQNLIIQKSLQ